MNVIEVKLTTFHQGFFWYLLEFDLRISYITSSASSLFVISMLSLFECITHSSLLPYLEEIKFIFIADWIFHVSDILKLFMKYFNHDLTL